MLNRCRSPGVATPRSADRGDDAGGNAYALDISQADLGRIRVVNSPQHWAHRVTLIAVAGRRHRVPARTMQAVTRSITPAARAALAPLAAVSVPGGYYLPCAMPLSPVRDVSVAEQAARIRDLSDEVLVEEVALFNGGIVPDAWCRITSEPGRWFQALADASVRTWAALSTDRQTIALGVEHEASRIGQAIMRGAGPEALNTLHPRLSYRDGTLRFTGSRCSCVHKLQGRSIALIPMFSGPTELCIDFNNPEVVQIGYPVALINQQRDALRGTTRSDPLAEMLGAMRARALRAAGRPITLGQLAGVLNCAASTASYQCSKLERMGLIDRDRRGERVWISRTERGSQIVDMLSE